MRRGKTSRVPKTRAGGEWTESAFWGFIRSGLRQMSRRWPPRSQVLKDKRVPYVGDSKRRKWSIKCDGCNGVYQLSEVQVDHIVPCGSLRSFEDIAGFVERMLCEVDGMQVLCKPCHERKGKE